MHLLLKKPSLDPMVLPNYRLFLNLLFLGKVIQTMTAKQFQVFLDAAAILDPFQSSYHPGHGMETVLVALTDDPWRHMDSGGLALLLLDLTAVSDMVNYDLTDPPHCNTGDCIMVAFLLSP